MKPKLIMKPKINWQAVGGIAFLACFWIAMVVIVIAMLSSCAPTKIIDRTETVKVGIDSTRVAQLVESSIKSLNQRIDSAMHAVTTQISTQQESEEQQRERITETITSWTDSLGRQFRQEQRTTDRDISKQQRLREERLVQEMETRLQLAITEHDSIWNARLEELRTHFERTDSIAEKKLSGKAAESWWDKLDSKLHLVLIIVLIVVLVLTRKIWLPLVRR